MRVEKTPMGWNSWNTFGQNIDEQLIRDSADALVRTGLKDAGYEYVVIDDCWSLRERVNGKLTPDPKKFPSGMKALADYIHEKGLKFGMYSCAGTMTCAGYPSSMDCEFTDARTFADWDVDFLKYDYCYKPAERRGYQLYRRMGLALENCGRDILFSACNWGTDNSHEWMGTTGAHMWRSTGDIFDGWKSVKQIIQQQIPILSYRAAGCFNDMDMLVVGMKGKGNVGFTGCTEAEYRTHFNAWCMLQSPLMIGCDVRNIDQTSLNILSNSALIGICRDAGNRQPYMLGNEEVPIFVRHLEGGNLALGFFNLSDGDFSFRTTLDDLGLPAYTGKTLSLTDLESGETLRPTNATLSIDLAPHASKVFRAKVIDL